ncbi:MAG TPA: hypothetical protein PKX05_05585, partial [bacterium]|nr:hypothetical protein [bacterium]
LGFLIGSVCGEIISLFTSARYIASMPIFNSCVVGFAPVSIELKTIHIDFGIKILVNFFSWIGLLISSLYTLIKQAIIE